MKKQHLIVSALCGLLMLSLTACGGSNTNICTPATPDPNESVQIANPWGDYDTLEEAEAAAGFDITLPAQQDDTVPVCRAMADSMIEVLYQKDGETVYSVRKGVGSEDISGDYNEYTAVAEVPVEDLTVTMKSNDGTLYELAVWTDGDYSYAISSDSGLSMEDMTALAEQLG